MADTRAARLSTAKFTSGLPLMALRTWLQYTAIENRSAIPSIGLATNDSGWVTSKHLPSAFEAFELTPVVDFTRLVHP